MRVRADLKCYNCGHVSGYVEGDAGAPFASARIIWRSPGGPCERRPGEPLRCRRCGGALYLEDITPVRPRPLSDAAPQPQRLLALA